MQRQGSWCLFTQGPDGVALLSPRACHRVELALVVSTGSCNSSFGESPGLQLVLI